MRRRVIDLDEHPPDASQLRGIDEMLVGIHRDTGTDVVYITIHMGSFDFQLQSPCRPATRSQAIGMARDFIHKIDFIGRVRWQLGLEGPVTDEPRL